MAKIFFVGFSASPLGYLTFYTGKACMTSSTAFRMNNSGKLHVYTFKLNRLDHCPVSILIPLRWRPYFTLAVGTVGLLFTGHSRSMVSAPNGTSLDIEGSSFEASTIYQYDVSSKLNLYTCTGLLGIYYTLSFESVK